MTRVFILPRILRFYRRPTGSMLITRPLHLWIFLFFCCLKNQRYFFRLCHFCFTVFFDESCFAKLFCSTTLWATCVSAVIIEYLKASMFRVHVKFHCDERSFNPIHRRIKPPCWVAFTQLIRLHWSDLNQFQRLFWDLNNVSPSI